MKKLLLASLAVLAMSAQALGTNTTTSTFNVNLSLTAACSLSTAADVTLGYTSFQGTAGTTATSGTTTAKVKCTDSLPYSLTLGAASVTDDVLNLTYTLAVAGPTTGSGIDQTHTVTVKMDGGQSGTCATSPAGTCNNASATNKQQTLTLTY